jgi:hypothetical protein
MKDGIKFIVSYSVLTLSLFAISKLLFKELSMEIFSYLLFYYIVMLAIGILLYPLVSWVLTRYQISTGLKLFISALFCLILINIIPFFYGEGKILLVEMFKGIFGSKNKLGFNNLGIHVIGIISFVVCYLLYRHDKLWKSE